jgi:hypothetical protein
MIKTYLGGLKKRVESIISKVHVQGITTVLSPMKLGLNQKHLNDVEINIFSYTTLLWTFLKIFCEI